MVEQHSNVAVESARNRKLLPQEVPDPGPRKWGSGDQRFRCELRMCRSMLGVQIVRHPRPRNYLFLHSERIKPLSRLITPWVDFRDV